MTGLQGAGNLQGYASAQVVVTVIYKRLGEEIRRWKSYFSSRASEKVSRNNVRPYLGSILNRILLRFKRTADLQYGTLGYWQIISGFVQKQNSDYFIQVIDEPQIEINSLASSSLRRGCFMLIHDPQADNLRAWRASSQQFSSQYRIRNTFHAHDLKIHWMLWQTFWSSMVWDCPGQLISTSGSLNETVQTTLANSNCQVFYCIQAIMVGSHSSASKRHHVLFGSNIYSLRNLLDLGKDLVGIICFEIPSK